MQLSVIILNYNVRYFLEQCIRSVLNAISEIDAEIIVVDNNSTDGSDVMMKELFPEILYINTFSNLGFPKGNNIGVTYAKGEYLCILNPDTVVGESTFKDLLAFAPKQENLGIVGCKLIDGRGGFLPESKRGIPTPWVSFSKAIGLNKIAPKSSFFNGYYAPELDKDQTGKVPILVGAFMFVPKEVYTSLGGFDEAFFMYVEDTDLSYRALKSGYSNFYKHDVVVIHYKGESTVKDQQYMKRFREGMQVFYKKHFTESYMFDLFMRLGSFGFMLLKKHKKGPQVKNPDQIILISVNKTLHAWAMEHYGTEIWMRSELLKLKHTLSKDPVKHYEIIFDGDFISNQEIISFMCSNSDKNWTYKIKPKDSWYLIGSNDSNDRGTVIKIDHQNLENDYNKSEILLNL